MLCSIYNKGLLPGIKFEKDEDLNTAFLNILQGKLKMTPKMITGNLGNYFEKFVK